MKKALKEKVIVDDKKMVVRSAKYSDGSIAIVLEDANGQFVDTLTEKKLKGKGIVFRQTSEAQQVLTQLCEKGYFDGWSRHDADNIVVIAAPKKEAIA